MRHFGRRRQGRVREHQRTARHQHPDRWRAVSWEPLESRQLLAAVVFSSQQIVDDLDADGANQVVAADLDGDGDLDAIVTSYRDDRVSWFENQGAAGFARHTLPGSAPQARDVVAADVDGDADLDLIVAAYYSDAIQWYENTDGRGAFAAPRTITDQVNGVRSLAVADFDSDGDMDVASASWFDNKLAWYHNDGQGNFSQQIVLSTNFEGPRSVRAADVDGDGRADLVIAARVGDAISWFRSLPSGGFGSQQSIPFAGNGPEQIALGDADGDGDLDLFVAVYWDTKLVWLENTDGVGGFNVQHEIGSWAERGQSLTLADLDGDGDLDVAATAYYGFDNRIVWYPNTDGQGQFGAERLLARDAVGAEQVTAADMNGDGRPDLLVASIIDNKVSLYTNTGQANFSGPQQVLSDAAGAASVDLADLDGDGDLDLVAGSYWDHEIAWYENLDGKGNYSDEKIISRAAQRVQSIHVADVNGDGAPDVLSASYADGKIAWYPNLDGRGNFGAQQLLTNRLNGPVDVTTADLDGDGDLDVVSASANDGIVAWFENLDGAGAFGAIQILTRRAAGAEWVSTADLDGDGDPEILAASYTDGGVRVFNNQGGGSFGAASTLTIGGGPTAVEAVDISGDGLLDLVATRYDANDLVWYPQLPAGGFGEGITIVQDLRRVEALAVRDINADGNPDLIVGGDLFLIWYEQLGGGEFTGHFVSGDLVQCFSVATGDIDGDGQVDLVSASFGDSKVAVYRNQSRPGDFDGDGNVDAADIGLLCQAIRSANTDAVFDMDSSGQIDRADMDWLVEQTLGTVYGDANLDGVFNSRDLVAIFQAGQYEDSVADNSTWSEGDWDCDGEFTTRDLVLAFQRGVYSIV